MGKAAIPNMTPIGRLTNNISRSANNSSIVTGKVSGHLVSQLRRTQLLFLDGLSKPRAITARVNNTISWVNSVGEIEMGTFKRSNMNQLLKGSPLLRLIESKARIRGSARKAIVTNKPSILTSRLRLCGTNRSQNTAWAKMSRMLNVHT